jgi:hypothetical protein
MAPTRNDMLKLIDEEGAWLEFLEQTAWYCRTNNIKIVEKALSLLNLSDSQKLAREVLYLLVSDSDLANTIQGVWEEYPNWWIKKYGN